MAEAGAGRGAAALRVGVRQRFSGFYDLNVRQDGGEHDLDSANFAAESYVQSVLKSKTLPQLVHHSNELSLEIKELDSDTQMLVYENYNKFISATETIQDMKSKVDSMEGEMGRLAAAVSEITESSARINDNLSDRRLRIQKLNGVRRLLKKLSFVFELPTRLKRAVELDAGAEALKYWRTALPVLTAYAHVPSFQAVENEAREILRQLEERLRARLQAADTPPAEAQEAATLLIDLGQPARPIRLQFVALISARLRLPAVLDQLPVAPERNQGGYALSDPNGALSCHFVQGIECGAAGSLMK